MNIGIITQARTGSTRFPNKILKKINNFTLLEIHLKRLKKCNLSQKIIVATTTKKTDNIIEEISKKYNIDFFRGSENDVLDRFYKTSIKFNLDIIVRVTSDCPLIDPILIDEMISFAVRNKLDYYTNTFNETFPDGLDVEIFTFNTLKYAWTNAKLGSEREHVTPYIRKHSNFISKKFKFKTEAFFSDINYNDVRMTVDELNDLEVIKILINKFGIFESWFKYANYYRKNNMIKSLNSKVVRNEGYIKSIEYEKKK